MKMWQIMIDENEKITFLNDKPFLKKNGVWANEDNDSISCFLFPVKLKPLQIAEIKVNENGTWSYEIEREEGWYIVRSKKTAEITIWQYKLSKWHYRDGDDVTTNLRDVNISSTRIPDECII